MGDVIHIYDYYERQRLRLLEAYQHSDSPDHRLKVANELSKLERRWSDIRKWSAKRNIEKTVHGNSY